MSRPSRLTSLLIQALLALPAAPQSPPQVPSTPGGAPQSPAPPAADLSAPRPANADQHTPFALVNPAGADNGSDEPGPRFSLDVSHGDATATLRTLARKSGRPLIILEMPVQLITVSFTNLPYEKALMQILAAGGLDYRKVDGGYVVGFAVDLRLKYPQPGETELDANYRCRRVDANKLAGTIGALIPQGLRIAVGPSFQSPDLKDGASGTDAQIRSLGGTDLTLKTHDVVFSGPADLVRRALTLAQKIDRPRKQVRLSVKIVTISESVSSSLGVDWMNSLQFTATEQGPKDATGTAASVVDGIRLGKFSHTPLVVNATIHALESKGLAKTLSNPTLMILDGERSFILDGQKYVYPDFKGKDNNGQAMYGVAEVKIGVYLQVGVQVGLDNDMVLSLYPQVTALNGTTVINNAAVPNLFTSEEQTTVRAISGEVLVLGGMRKESRTSDRDGLPFLGRLPLVGSLFSSHEKHLDKSELMIILTPEILEDPAPEGNVNLTVADYK